MLGKVAMLFAVRPLSLAAFLAAGPLPGARHLGAEAAQRPVDDCALAARHSG
jgi:hypothetical protein